MKPGVNASFLFIRKNIREMTSRTERKRQSNNSLSLRKNTQFFRDSKDAMAVCAFNELKRHSGSAANGVKVAAGSTETAFATEGNNF